MNYGKFILDNMLKTTNKIALINGVNDERITFGEMVQEIVDTANSIKHSEISCGDVVALCSENRFEFLITATALWCNGVTVTFINPAYSIDDFVYTMNISKPGTIILSPQAHEKFLSMISKLDYVDKLHVFGYESIDECNKKYVKLSKVHVSVEDFMNDFKFEESPTALILYSSGTTGLPKGANATHDNLIFSGSRPPISNNDMTTLSVTPWVNSIGIILTMKDLLRNQTVVFLPGFKQEKYLSCIQKYKIGKLLAVPPLIVMLVKSSIILDYDTSSVEILHTAGSKLDIGIINEIKTKLPKLRHILQGFGMTETSGLIAQETEDSHKPGSIGKVVPGNIVKVANISTDESLGPNQEGELRVKGPGLFTGYIGCDLSRDLDSEGYFKTGDVCYYDEEGYFYYVDRIKELIKYKAGQVSPSELEAILLQHPGVADAAVIGTPDEIAGELPTAFVVKRAESDVTAEELILMVDVKVSSWKRLRGGVFFVDNIEKTTSGKIVRRLLRDFVNSNNVVKK